MMQQISTADDAANVNDDDYAANVNDDDYAADARLGGLLRRPS
jgi:hypothetical protein